MNRHRSRKQFCIWLLVTGLGVSTGCSKWSTIKRNCLPFGCAEQAPKASIIQTEHCTSLLPSESVPSPPGTYVQRWQDAMVYQADGQQLIVTRNLWFDGGNQLGPKGQEHLMAIGKRLTCEPTTVLIEEEPVQVQPGQTYEEAVFATTRLNNQRRSAIVYGLTALQIPFAEEWIVFTSDRSVGVRGVEAPNVYNRQFSGQGMRNRGGFGQGGLGGGLGGGFGGFGGGGFGGGGFGGGFGGGGFGGGMGGFF